MNDNLRIRATNERDQAWVRAFTIEYWGDETVVAHGTVFVPHQLRGFVAERGEGTPLGLATYSLDGADCELITLNALQPGVGIGTALLSAVTAAAREAGCARLWLMTTNDNVRALAFYQKRGFDLVAVHRGALARSRKLKPSIPLVAHNDIPLQHEVELELTLSR